MYDEPCDEVEDTPPTTRRRRRVGVTIIWVAVVGAVSIPLIIGGLLIRQYQAVQRLNNAGAYVDTSPIGPPWIVDNAGDLYRDYVNTVEQISLFDSTSIGDAELLAPVGYSLAISLITVPSCDMNWGTALK